MSIAELIIGMSLVVMLIGLVVPRVDTGYIRTEWERRKFCSELRALKRRDFAGAKESLVINRDKNGGYYYRIISKATKLKKVDIDKDILVETNMNQIGFNINGTPAKSGEIRFVYKSKVYKITITPASGRILLKEGIYSNDTR